VSYLEFLKFIKGNDQVTKEAREEIRDFLVTQVFQVTDGSQVPEDQVLAVFSCLDSDQSGEITVAEFKEALLAAGMPADAEQVELLLAVFDTNDDGSVSALEFLYVKA
jgi:Ca2+-binding EF-hand superfamily protein